MKVTYRKHSYYINVEVQFFPWFNLDFPLFFTVRLYDNEYMTKENQDKHQ